MIKPSRFSKSPFICMTAVIALCVLTAAGCEQQSRATGSGSSDRESRPVSGFTRVAVGNQGDLFIKLGDQEELVIEAEEEVLEKIETKVRGKTLEITTMPHTRIRTRKPIRYHLTARSLEGLIISSSGDIKAPALDADVFSVQISSSGDMHIESLRANALEIRISSSGDLTIDAGEVEEQDITISSSGDYEGGDVVGRRANVYLSSSGDAKIHVTDELKARLSSSGDLYLTGKPTLDVYTSSSGEVIQR